MWKHPRELRAPAHGGDMPGGLVGRATEVSDLGERLAGHRLVTLTGCAGVGKSRLAAHMVDTADRPPWQRAVRVRWQGNGPGPDGALTAAVINALVGVRPLPAHADLTAVLPHMPKGPTLLYLDDIDPVHTECLRLVRALLDAVPGMRVLITSRRPLGLGDEQVLRITPLSTRPDNGLPSPAARLFWDRADNRVRRQLRSKTGHTAVTTICRLLDGLPLAIELAAHEAAVCDLDELTWRLEHSMCWLNSPHPAVERHRSLRTAVGAAYALCDPAVRSVWARASVFAGAFAESAAVYLCSGGNAEPAHVAACLTQLAAIGVLDPVGDPDGPYPPRYAMTGAARDFGTERLKEAGEFAAAAQRLLIHCRRAAEAAESLWDHGIQSQAVRLVAEEHDNIMTMVAHALILPDHVPAALDVVNRLWFWWMVYGKTDEGLDCLLRLLSLYPQGSAMAVRGRWLTAWLMADTAPDSASAYLAQVWPAAVLSGDDATIGRIAHVQGAIALRRGDYQAAASHFREAAATIPAGAPGGPGPVVSLAAQAVAEAAFAPRASSRTAHRALTHPGAQRDAWATLLTRYARALTDHHHGHPSRAWRNAHRALAGIDNHLPIPRGATALQQLLSDITSGVPRLPSPPDATTTARPLAAVAIGATLENEAARSPQPW
ncbi:hypothetical protein AB0A76_21310 [Streptomyces exfoliatus]|uniref:Uncharacterized protein n=1 Tax=Streptomyces exfoliatus TaxID=1905 RepID=A0ABV3CZS3_STREX